MEGEIVKKDVIETYVPLLRDHHFIGAFEIYYDITYSGHSINKYVAKSHLIIFMISLSLLLCILTISLSSIIYLKKLLKTEKKLQTLGYVLAPYASNPVLSSWQKQNRRLFMGGSEP